MNRIEACIFDLDGVIVDTAKYHYKAWKRLADALNIFFGKEENQQLKGLSRHESLQRILALDDCQVSDEEFQELMDRKNRWYQKMIADLSPADILPGIPAFLDELQSAGIQRAIGSSSKNAPRIISALQLEDTFRVMVDGQTVQHTKPDPEVFFTGAKRLEVDPGDCVVFEDAVHGIEAARRAGMVGVGVGSPRELDKAEFVIPGFEQFELDDLRSALNN